MRHINFEKQINMIKDLEKEKKAIYIYPTKTSNVTRLGGSREELEDAGATMIVDSPMKILDILK